MNDTDFDIAIIGGGVVGLAIAERISADAGSVVLFEQHEDIGRETSSRNSEVIHAGIYYASCSLKAQLCVEGRKRLYKLAKKNKIPYFPCGKIIIASNAGEIPSLENLLKQGKDNGVESLRMLSSKEVRSIEPNVTACAGLYSPETGVIDSHKLMSFLKDSAEAKGALIVFGAEVTGLNMSNGLWEVQYNDSEGKGDVCVRAVINSAGLSAHTIMKMAGINPDALRIPLYLVKGEYFSIAREKQRMVNALVYPSPQANLTGLGIHTVVDTAGKVKLGPNAVYVDKIDYTVDPDHGKDFFDSVSPFLPFLEREDLVPDMSGIRPKLSGPGDPAADFYIVHEAENGAPGLFNLAGIESPGLTASPAIARLMAEMVHGFL